MAVARKRTVWVRFGRNESGSGSSTLREWRQTRPSDPALGARKSAGLIFRNGQTLRISEPDGVGPTVTVTVTVDEGATAAPL